MEKLSLTTTFVRTINLDRYSFYASYGALAWWMEATQFALFCAIAAVLMHVVQSIPRFRFEPLWRGAYGLEFAAALLLALLDGLTLVMTGVLLLVFLASNTALWGPRTLPWLGCAGIAIATVVVALRGPLILSSNPTIDVLALLVACVFMLAVCAVSHRQAQSILAAKQNVAHQRRALLRYLPRDFPTHLAERGEGQVARTWFSIAFVDLTGFTQVTRDLPAEELNPMLSEFFSEVNRLVESWGGCISKFTGDGALCVFGGGMQRANAALQCARCAQRFAAMIEVLNRRWQSRGQLQTLEQTLQVSVGVASGFCTIGDWGSKARWDYTVVGEPVNLAARLQAEAGGHGGTLLDTTTARLVCDAFDFSEPIWLDLKGLGATTAFSLPLAEDAATRTSSPDAQASFSVPA